MATETTVQTTEAVKKNPLYLFPAFTCERWRDGMYDSDHKKKTTSLNIRQDELLTFDQRVELETRSLVLQYQIKYAEKEYEMMRTEFKKIEEELKKGETSDAEHAFAKPKIPSKEPKKTKKTKSDSGASGDETTGKPKGRGGQGKSGSDTEKKGTSTKSRSERSAKKSGSSTSESEADKGLTSSTESTGEPKATRGRRKK